MQGDDRRMTRSQRVVVLRPAACGRGRFGGEWSILDGRTAERLASTKRVVLAINDENCARPSVAKSFAANGENMTVVPAGKLASDALRCE